MNLQKEKWEKLPLGELCELYQPKTISANEFIKDGEYNVWGANGIVGKYNQYNHEEEQILISCRGANCGVINYSNKYSWITGNSMVAKPKDENKILKNFLLHLLKVCDLSSTINGTAQPQITRKSLYGYKIPIPTVDEQQKIAGLFQSIDDSSEKIERQEKNLLNFKNLLLRDLFSEKRQFANYLNEDDFETVKFEQIAFHISERVEPQETDYTIYVGLEHLDPDNLKIERKGKPEDVIGTKLKIYKGDIIFGKRRAYQRKVAVSDFEGIVSAHSMVLRANEKAIEKELLPFFMQSDAFMNRAVQISEGSLSPTIKWKVLATQQFVIPKREKQKQIAETFIHFDKVIEEIRQQKQTLKNLKFKLLNEILG